MTPCFPLRLRCTAAAAALLLAGASYAAGPTSVPELQGAPVPPAPAAVDPSVVPAAPPAPQPTARPDAGLRVELQRVEFHGNRSLGSEELERAIGPLAGRRFGLPELEQLTQVVLDAYKAHGMPFVRAVLPPQRLDAGVLRIDIVEGVLSRATANGPDPLAGGAQAFMEAGLPRGEVLREAQLERTMLLLNDQPGFRVQPALRAGARPGESELDVAVERRSRVSGEVALDNAGNEATGTYRARAALGIDSPFRFGDRVAFSALTTDRGLWLGSADYETPLGADGWRGLAGVSRSSYQLGGAFAALDASGTADVAQLRLSRAVVRSQGANLTASLTVQAKRLQDRLFGDALVRDKSSRLAIAALQFDHRDGLAGGGVTYGQASLTAGRLVLDGDSAATDAVTAGSAGGFIKWNLDLARIQALPGAFSLYGRVSVQGTNDNLDSSEKYGTGGFLGVRAYPLGEASGDRAWLTQLELRWAAADGQTLFAFTDASRARSQARPWDEDSAGSRRIAGSGIGVRSLVGAWRLESTLAWRTHGGPALAESRDRSPRWFAVATYAFAR